MNNLDLINIDDPEVLQAYLRRRGLFTNCEPRIQPLAGGVSSRTILVSDDLGGGLVIKQALTQLRVADEWFCSPERMHREALGLRLLGTLEPRGVVPEFVFEDREQHILAMRAIPQPHENFKAMLLAGEVDMDLFRQLGRLLAAMQGVVLDPSTSQELSDTSFFESLRLEPYYLTSARRVPEAADFLHTLVNQTRDRHATLVHGDFSPKNLLVHNGSLCLLDFEVIHLGDGGFDMGFSLSHLLAKALHLPKLRRHLLQGADEYLCAYRSAALPSTMQSTMASASSHTLACLLARVVGRSPLDYLSAAEKDLVRKLVVDLMARQIQSPEELLGLFASGLHEMENV